MELSRRSFPETSADTLNISLAARFGHGVLFGLGLTFFGPIFYMILGLGASEYNGNPEEGLPARKVMYV